MREFQIISELIKNLKEGKYNSYHYDLSYDFCNSAHMIYIKTSDDSLMIRFEQSDDKYKVSIYPTSYKRVDVEITKEMYDDLMSFYNQLNDKKLQQSLDFIERKFL